MSWNIRELLRASLSSLFASSRVSFEVLVVDNASTDGSVEMVKETFPQVKLIDNQENLGFAKANNQAIKQAMGKYLFILNPDTEVERETLIRLKEYLDQNEEVGLVGPRIEYGGKNLQYSCKSRFPNLSDAWFSQSLVLRFFSNKKVSDSMNMVEWDHYSIKEVAWVMGAAMFLRREMLEQIEGFDEDFFMYFEDVDLCYRAKRSGWKIIYYPEAKVTHHEGQSSEKVGAKKGIMAMQSAIKYYRKRSFVQGILVWSIYLLTSLGYGLALLGKRTPAAEATSEYNLALFRAALWGWWFL